MYDREQLVGKKTFGKVGKLADLSAIKDLNAGGIAQIKSSQTSALQIICGAIAVLITVWCVYVFYDAYRAENYSSFLCELEPPKLQVFALFFALLAGVAMAFVGRKHRVLTITLGVLIAGFLGTLPYIFPVKMSPAISGDGTHLAAETSATEQTPVKEDKVELTYDEEDMKPLLTAVADADGGNVLGLWVSGVNDLNLPILKSYLGRMANSGQDVPYYERKDVTKNVSESDRSGLLVLKSSPLAFDAFRTLVQRMGAVVRQDPARGFIEIRLNRGKFDSAPSAVLEKENHQFYALANLRELSMFDVNRVIEAAERLSKVKVNAELRAEVVKKLLELIREPWGGNAEFVMAVTKALVNWGDKNDADVQKEVCFATVAMKNAKEAKCEIPDHVLRFALHASREPQLLAVLLEKWKKEPAAWENDCIAVGADLEAEVLAVLKDSENYVQKRSAAHILGQVGTPASLNVLKSFTDCNDKQLSTNAAAAVELIEKRPAPPATN